MMFIATLHRANVRSALAGPFRTLLNIQTWRPCFRQPRVDVGVCAQRMHVENNVAKGYWMFHTTVTDAEVYKRYVERDGKAFEKYDARFLARGGEFQLVEGSAQQRHVIIEFESYEAARACYHSREYQSASEFRRAAAVTDLIIVKGVD